ncbi:MAG TPA: MarR family winged helix-turn-helix transcriptional regulator [Gemmatimonadaceae bacterium]|jgi:DNA-binding MarR family transcriptional regulator|nr:MarR family winged helix-turn-helix transcriptional regulator [Gemmatimonadaceae bacterium]
MPRRRNTASPFRVLSPIHQANRQAGLYIDGLLAEFGISAQEGQLLAFVAARDGVPVTAIVRLLGVPKSTMTSLLHRLERAKLLMRDANPQDARSALLFVTVKGRRAGALARERVLELERRIQSRVSAADMRALARIVGAVTAETGIDLPGEAPRRDHS